MAGVTLCQSQNINEDAAFDPWFQMINQIVTIVAGSSWPQPVWSKELALAEPAVVT